MLSQSECDDLSLAVNNLTFEITGTGGFDSSQVTAGGVTTRCIIPVDMSFFGDNHIYIIGELLDVDGKCGGYNLMWAIITGMRAGSSIYNK
jgi:predicted flavoprotein YhiN